MSCFPRLASCVRCGTARSVAALSALEWIATLLVATTPIEQAKEAVFAGHVRRGIEFTTQIVS